MSRCVPLAMYSGTEATNLTAREEPDVDSATGIPLHGVNSTAGAVELRPKKCKHQAQ